MRAVWALIITCSCLAGAQQKPAMTPSAKLAAARSAYLQRVGASDVAWNVITSGIEDWGRYTLVDAPEKADIVIELSQSAEGGMSIQSSTSTTTPTGQKQDKANSSTRVSMTPVKMVVYDARTRMPLWSGTEQPKFAIKQKTREDNVLEAAQRLLAKFHQRVEPEPAP